MLARGSYSCFIRGKLSKSYRKPGGVSHNLFPSSVPDTLLDLAGPIGLEFPFVLQHISFLVSAWRIPQFEHLAIICTTPHILILGARGWIRMVVGYLDTKGAKVSL